MKEDLKTRLRGAAVLATSAYLFAPAAFAQAIDVSDVADKITDQLGPITTLGSAVLGIIVAIKAYQWVRRAMN